MERIIAVFNQITDNVWAFLLFALAAFVAIASAVLGMLIAFHFHSSDTSIAKDLLGFAGTLATAGGLLFQSSKNNNGKEGSS